LPSAAFLSAPNLDVYRQAAMTGRSPRATAGQRGRSQFALFEEMASSGAISKEVLESTKSYQQSRSLVQRENVMDAAIAFLQGSGVTANFRDARGQPNSKAIENSLMLASKGPGQKTETAQMLLQSLRQAEQGVKNTEIVTNGGVSAYAGGKRGEFIGSGGLRMLNSEQRSVDSRDWINSENLPFRVPQKSYDLTGFNRLKDAPFTGNEPVVSTAVPEVKLDINVNVNGAVSSSVEESVVNKISSAISDIITKGLSSQTPSDRMVQEILRKLGVNIPKPIPPTPPPQGRDLEAGLRGPMPTAYTR
jgi:hypothetical protein